MQTEVQIEKILKDKFNSLEVDDWFYASVNDDERLYIKINSLEAMRFWTKNIVIIDPSLDVVLVKKIEIKIFL